MPITPDRHPGPADEEGVVWEEATSDPTQERQLIFVQDKGLTLFSDGVARPVGAAGREEPWQFPVIDKDLTAPPGGESAGDRYIVASVATGLWATHEGKIAQYIGTGWVFSTPFEGMQVYVADEDKTYTQTSVAPGWIWSASIGDVSSTAAITDHAIVRGDGGARGIQDSGATISDSDEVVIPSANGVVGLEIGTGTYPINIGIDSSGIPYLGRKGVAGTFRFSPGASNPQWLFGDPLTDGGNVYIDSDSLTGGGVSFREIRLNTLSGAGLGAAVTVGAGGFAPNVTNNTPLGTAARRWQRAHINHLATAVDVDSGAANLDDATFVVAQDGTYTLTLPTAAEGWLYLIERQGSTGVVTLAPGGADTINGGGSTVLEDDTSYVIIAEDATDWRMIALGITRAEHRALRQLIHFIDDGPAEGFASGAYKETTGTVFPTAIVWWESVSKLKKIVERLITWTGANPTTDQWKSYDTDGTTVLWIVTDTISYTGPFETSRTRTIAAGP